jgi:hypothetical protein
MVTRRTLLAAAASPFLLPGSDHAAPPALPDLAPVAPERRAFAPAEQRFAPYLATLAPMFDDIEDVADPAVRGHFGGGWWRKPTGPTNARVQEHVFTLSWYYANARRWNPYYRDPALLTGLDAAIGHYLYLQHPDGSFPEYNVDEHGLAPTGFGIGYLAKTLRNLRQAAALPQRQTQIKTALRTAMGWLLDPGNGIWTPPVHYANQVTAGLAGSAYALTQFNDPALRARLTERMLYHSRHSQSPAGFFYEPTGMDINYNFEVMLPELAEYFRLTASPVAASMASKFAGWFGHVMLREPDGSGSPTTRPRPVRPPRTTTTSSATPTGRPSDRRSSRPYRRSPPSTPRGRARRLPALSGPHCPARCRCSPSRTPRRGSSPTRPTRRCCRRRR